MKVKIIDIWVKSREIEVPVICSHCKADLTSPDSVVELVFDLFSVPGKFDATDPEEPFTSSKYKVPSISIFEPGIEPVAFECASCQFKLVDGEFEDLDLDAEED